MAHMRHLVESLQHLEDKPARRRRCGAHRKAASRGQDDGARAHRPAARSGQPLPRNRAADRYDKYEGQAPAAGVVTGIGKIEGRPAVIVANDATVKAGAWWPETITKILRAQEIAMRNRTPIVYLVDSAGVNLPYQDGIFPGQYGAGRIFFYNSLMRRKLHVPQIAAVMGPCIAGGAYLPALSDVIIMVENTSFMGLGGPNLVKGATGQSIDQESLGGAHLHNATSGVAHYVARNDEDCLDMIRARFRQLPLPPHATHGAAHAAKSADDIYSFCLPIIDCLTTSKICWRGSLTRRFRGIPGRIRAGNAVRTRGSTGTPVAVIANRRGFLKPAHRRHHLHRNRAQGGVLRRTGGAPGRADIYVQDVSGFMVGQEGGERGHHPGRRRDGGNDVVRERAAHRADHQSCEWRWLLRDGGPGLRSELHVQLADGAHRRDGRRLRGAGAVFGGTGKAEESRRAVPDDLQESMDRRAPIMSAGSMRSMRRRAATAMPSSIRKRRGKC
jgi:3-methylcrotonyl-CoA carboxylase beta subunit